MSIKVYVNVSFLVYENTVDILVEWFYMQFPNSLTNSVGLINLAIDAFRFSTIIVNYII